MYVPPGVLLHPGALHQRHAVVAFHPQIARATIGLVNCHDMDNGKLLAIKEIDELIGALNEVSQF
jgi:hypothetical protein